MKSIFIQVTQMTRPNNITDLKAKLIARQVAVSPMTYNRGSPVLNGEPSNLRTICPDRNISVFFRTCYRRMTYQWDPEYTTNDFSNVSHKFVIWRVKRIWRCFCCYRFYPSDLGFSMLGYKILYFVLIRLKSAYVVSWGTAVASLLIDRGLRNVLQISGNIWTDFHRKPVCCFPKQL